MSDTIGKIDTTRRGEGIRLTCACGWTVDAGDELEAGDEFACHVAETGDPIADHTVSDLEPCEIEIDVDPLAVPVVDDLLAGDIDEEPLSDHDVNVLAAGIVAKLPDCPLDEWEELGLATIETFTDSAGEEDYRSMQLNRNGLRVFGRVLLLAIKRA